MARARERERTSEHEGPRCPYCRDPTADDAQVALCPGCSVRLHLDCLGELTRCTSLGCAVKPRDFVAGAERRPLLTLPPSGSLWGIALKRGLLVGLVFALPLTLVVGLQEGFLQSGTLINLAVGLSVGVMALPGTLLEAWDARRAPRLGRHLAGAWLNALSGLLGGLGAWFAALTLFRLRYEDSLGQALGHAWESLRDDVATRPFPAFYLVVLMAVAMGAVGFSRLRGWRLRSQTALSAGVVGALALVLWGLQGDANAASRQVFAALAAAMATLLPAACWLVESVRWRAWNPLRKAGKKP